MTFQLLPVADGSDNYFWTVLRAPKELGDIIADSCVSARVHFFSVIFIRWFFLSSEKFIFENQGVRVECYKNWRKILFFWIKIILKCNAASSTYNSRWKSRDRAKPEVSRKVADVEGSDRVIGQSMNHILHNPKHFVTLVFDTVVNDLRFHVWILNREIFLETLDRIEIFLKEIDTINRDAESGGRGSALSTTSPNPPDALWYQGYRQPMLHPSGTKLSGRSKLISYSVWVLRFRSSPFFLQLEIGYDPRTAQSHDRIQSL